MSDSVEKIKERLSIADVVGSYVQLQKAGINYKARCPFHNEKTPSFFVSPARNSFYCFGCGAKGDIFSFVEKFEGLDFVGALKQLADRAGVTLEKTSPEDRTEKEELFAVMEEAVSHFEQELKGRGDVKDYLRVRGLSEETISSFRIGYAKKDWRDLISFLRLKGFSDSVIDRAGLGKVTEKGMYDRFRGRIMFPIMDPLGRPVAFSGRVFEEEVDKDGNVIQSGKYVNSPETPLFSKSKILYGIDKAKNGIRKWSFALLVEGQIDLLMSHQAGFTNTLALSGTALTEEHIALIKRFTNRLVLALDRDAAGLSATGKSASLALASGMDVKVALLSDKKDPAEIIKDEPESFKEAVRKASHIVDFYLAIIRGSGYDERKFRLEVGRIVLPLIAGIQSGIDKAHFIAVVSEALRLPESVVREDIAKLKIVGVDKTEERGSSNLEVLPRKNALVKRLVGINRAFPNSAATHSQLKEILGEDVDTLLGNEEFVSEAAFDAERFFVDDVSLEKETRVLLLDLKKELLLEKRGEIQKALKEMEKSGGETDELVKNFQNISAEISKLEKDLSN